MIRIVLLLFSLSRGFVKSQGFIMFFFDPTCPYCQREVYEMKALYNQGYNVIGITNGSTEGLKLPFPVKQDEGEADYVGVQSVPTIALLFPKQKKLFVLSEGYISAQDLLNRIDLLKWPSD